MQAFYPVKFERKSKKGIRVHFALFDGLKSILKGELRNGSFQDCDWFSFLLGGCWNVFVGAFKVAKDLRVEFGVWRR